MKRDFDLLERHQLRVSHVLPCQMWMSAWKGLTTATSMPSARTRHGHTSASASPATLGMANTVKVRFGGAAEGPAPQFPEERLGGTAAGPAPQFPEACSLYKPRRADISESPVLVGTKQSVAPTNQSAGHRLRAASSGHASSRNYTQDP